MITFLPNDIAVNIVSVIALPMLLSIFAFYKWLFAFISSKHLSKADSLYHDVAMYNIAEMTSTAKTSANINSIFCICLLFSGLSFICGVLFLNNNIEIFAKKINNGWAFCKLVYVSFLWLFIFLSYLYCKL